MFEFPAQAYGNVAKHYGNFALMPFLDRCIPGQKQKNGNAGPPQKEV
jgi:hypothetical protein